MPLLLLKTSGPPPADRGSLQRDLSRELAAQLGKPERYVMVLMEFDLSGCFGGGDAPCGYVEVKSIGQLDGDQPGRISAAVCTLLERHLSLPSARVYIGFEDVPARLWGWDGSTFG
jgi:phenylpyruvate tautomerase PptA (4-oxalocrotonate tautomerase family)